MTTSGTADVPNPPTPTLRLDEGPLGEAMAQVDRAVAGIEEAEEALVSRRRELAAVLAEELAAVLDAEPDDVVEEVRPTLSSLYWEHADVIRVKDLTDATGLTGSQLRKVVGPRVQDLPCDGCGRSTEVVRRSRSDLRRPLCQVCRMPSPDPWRVERSDDVLDRLVDHLDVVVQRDGCDGRLTATRAWAAAVGLDPEALAAEVRSHGGHCDCEVASTVTTRRW